MNVALRSDSLNIISLCTGGGGLDLGVELAMPGARSVVLVEREAFAASHLVSAMQEGLLAQAPIWSDVTTFNGRPWRGLVDGLIGGIPCQPHSLAGKRLGEDDERDLWSDARRIIVQSGAWFVLIENVRGIVSSGGAERVWRDLCRLGFDVEAGLFTAAEVGASHERERWFCLAVADRDNQHDHGSRIERAGWRGQSPNGGPQLADAGRQRDERWRRAGDVLRSASPPKGQGHQRQRDGNAAHDSGDDLANADDARLEGHRQHGECSGKLPARSGGGELGHTSRDGWREGRPQPEFRSGRNSVVGTDSPMGHAISSRHDGRSLVAIGGPIGRTTIEGPSERLSLFPPGPSDLHRWWHTLQRSPELEPAFRRVADGLASRLDVARVDRLRLLGNGVVSLAAAYAYRTLTTRLAATGSAGAIRLVRMMESAHPGNSMSSQVGGST